MLTVAQVKDFRTTVWWGEYVKVRISSLSEFSPDHSRTFVMVVCVIRLD